MTEDELLEEDEKEVVGLYRAAEDMFFGSRQENVCFWTAAHALSVLSSGGQCLCGKRLLLPFSSLAELRLKMVVIGYELGGLDSDGTDDSFDIWNVRPILGNSLEKDRQPSC